MELSSSSSSSSSDPSYTLIKVDEDGRDDPENYDVFLSFRGEDTRKNFLGHLRSALCDKGLKVFVDDVQLSRGLEISVQLIQAIEASSCSVVVISPNYASSTWCLEELVRILDCMKTRAQIVIPVFYHVDPSDVRKQTGSFKEAFEIHEKRFEDDLERVNQWRLALTEITSLVGLDLNNFRDEASLIREIIGEVSRKLTTLVSSKTSEDQQILTKALKVFGEISWTIIYVLFFFLVVFPLFILFFIKVVIPVSNSIISIGDNETPFSSNYWPNQIEPECEDGMVKADMNSPMYKNLFPKNGRGILLCIGSGEAPAKSPTDKKGRPPKNWDGWHLSL